MINYINFVPCFNIKTVYLAQSIAQDTRFINMSNRFLKIHPSDNVYVALTDLKAGEKLTLNGGSLTLVDDVPAKHKFLEKPLQPEEEVIMYGTVVGKALTPIQEGGVIGTHNIKHKAAPYSGRTKTYQWTPPDVSKFKIVKSMFPETAGKYAGSA